MESEVGFEVAMKQLEMTVGALEGGEMGLDGALRQYEQSVKLLRYCNLLLDGAELAVSVLKGVGPSGVAETAAFGAAAGGGLDREDDTA